MASAVLADPTRALHGTNRGSGLAMDESKNDVGGLEQLLLVPSHQYTVIICPQNKPGFITKHKLLPFSDTHIDLTWHHYRRSCRCSCVKGSAWKERLDLKFFSARCLVIVCGKIATPTSARFVERVTVGCTSACRTILGSSLLVVFLVAPDPVFKRGHLLVSTAPQFLTAHSKRSTCPATRRMDQPAVFIPMVRPLSNSPNCEKCLLALLPDMFRLPKSSYNRWVIITFMNLRICAGL
ncbi:uncharacterized protein TNCV_414761 [Trichonephila clavipes]|nr:uncharacterized protein TNCV_414761 [Trichonephila clavipes]